MKKISVVIPVYNEEKNILECLKAILNSDYSFENYEIIVIDDASTDNTFNEVAAFKKKNGKPFIRIMKNKHNLGRMQSRTKGAKIARYENVFFVDSRVQIDAAALKNLAKTNEKTIMPEIIQQKPANSFELFFQLLRNKIYTSKEENKKITKITKENFDKMGKGTTAAYINKNLFLKAVGNIKNTSIHCSDDTILLKEILKLTPYIKKNHSVKIKYNQRAKPKEVFLHTYNRGPKFVDYYFKPKRRFFIHLLAVYIITSLTIIMLITDTTKTLTYLTFTPLALLLAPLLIIEKKAQYFKIILPLTLVSVAFYLGLLKGLAIKIKNL